MIAVARVAVRAVALVDAVVVAAEDRFGLGWRGPLAAGILGQLEQLDCLEIIAESFDNLPLQQRGAIKYLSKRIPISLHGVSLGLASSAPLMTQRVEWLARRGDELQAESITEHLAFVRANNPAAGVSPTHTLEIGHLAAPPRNNASVHSCCEHILSAAKILGRPLALENIASLITPFGSELTETQWLSQILRNTGTGFLLDLENLYANALNRQENPADLLLELPLEQVHTIHLSGGSWVNYSWRDQVHTRFIDDHQNDIPQPVFDLLELVAERAPKKFTVIIERDGNYPSIEHLMAQLNIAKQIVQRGRENALSFSARTHSLNTLQNNFLCIDNQRIEYLLAQLLCDKSFRQTFIDNPQLSLSAANLSAAGSALEEFDWVGLYLSAKSVSHKNNKKRENKIEFDEGLITP